MLQNSSCNSWICLSQCQKDFGATFEKKKGKKREKEKKEREEKVRRERERRTSVILGE
jgi:hypothetical protein